MKTHIIKNLLSQSPIIPVVIINNIDHAIPIAKALMKGGINIIEVTLRTDVALKAITLIRDELPSICVGAGTVTTPQLLTKAINAKAQFIVSPGVTDELLVAADQLTIPLLPGAATASEAMKLQAKGYSHLKFFPAEAAGGVEMLKSLSGPLPNLVFCPTGGINQNNYHSYLALKNVICVGSSWITDKILIEQENWKEITHRAKQLLNTNLTSVEHEEKS